VTYPWNSLFDTVDPPFFNHFVAPTSRSIMSIIAERCRVRAEGVHFFFLLSSISNSGTSINGGHASQLIMRSKGRFVLFPRKGKKLDLIVIPA
jgi:hypothetical protein